MAGDCCVSSTASNCCILGLGLSVYISVPQNVSAFRRASPATLPASQPHYLLRLFFVLEVVVASISMSSSHAERFGPAWRS